MPNVKKSMKGASVRADFLHGENKNYAKKKALNRDFH